MAEERLHPREAERACTTPGWISWTRWACSDSESWDDKTCRRITSTYLNVQVSPLFCYLPLQLFFSFSLDACSFSSFFLVRNVQLFLLFNDSVDRIVPYRRFEVNPWYFLLCQIHLEITVCQESGKCMKAFNKLKTWGLYILIDCWWVNGSGEAMRSKKHFIYFNKSR